MKLNIRPDITITLDDEMVSQFSSHYYPLDNQTADIFISSMCKENQRKLQELIQSRKPDVVSIRDIFAAELTHAVSLIQLCK